MLNSVVTVSFSETVIGVDSTTFIVKDSLNNSVTGAVVNSGHTATFTPSSPFSCSTTYMTALSSGITDLANNPLATLSWSFTTRDVTAWSFIDSSTVAGINKNTAWPAYNPQLTIFGSKLYAIWQEYGATTNQIRVAVYNDNAASPSWAFVDGNGVDGINKNTARSASTPQLTVFGSKLYATWREYSSNNDQIRVAVYNGNDTSPSWAFVDGNGVDGINKNTARAANTPQLTVFGSKLYATWEEYGSTCNQIRVAVYNGNDASSSWTFVDGNGVDGINKNTARPAYNPQLTIFGSKLYAIWHEYGATTEQIRVAVYNGNDASPSWVFVDGNGVDGINKNTARSADTPQLTVFGSKLYATWQEYGATTNQIRAAVYNGNDASPSWAFVDGNGVDGINKNTAWSADAPQLTVFGSKLYAIWQESGATTNQIRVAVYSGNDTSSTWAFVDGNGVDGINKNTAWPANNPQLTVFGSKIYATWQEFGANVDQIRVGVGQ